jgi:hypothetical protein
MYEMKFFRASTELEKITEDVKRKQSSIERLEEQIAEMHQQMLDNMVKSGESII